MSAGVHRSDPSARQMRISVEPIAIVLSATIACAPAHATSSSAQCSVVAGQKLLAGSGGAPAVCSDVERAIASVAPGVRYEARISALSSSRLAAILVVNGRTLPEQHFAIMDRELNRAAVERFAHSLAIEVAKAAKP